MISKEQFRNKAMEAINLLVEAINKGDVLSLAMVATLDQTCANCQGSNCGMVFSMIESEDVDALDFIEIMRDKALEQVNSCENTSSKTTH